jgi:hypothetical protein
VKCVSCNRPIGQAAVMVGAYAYGPKCARKAGLIVSAPVAAVKQPAPDERQMPLGLTAPATAKQGLAYFHDGRKCIALEAGHNVEVMGYDENNPWYFTKWRVSADALTPAPSRYLGGAIPCQ